MINCFDFYNLPVQFHINQKELRNKYLEIAKNSHPDFFSLEHPDIQGEKLSASAVNNYAYKTLGNNQNRLVHILQLYEMLDEDLQNISNVQLPAKFLMEMMEQNENAESAIIENNKESIEKLLIETQKEIISLEKEWESMFKTFDIEQGKAEREKILQIILVSYLKAKYFWRLQENLHKFAS